MCQTVTGYMSGGLLDMPKSNYGSQAVATEQQRAGNIQRGVQNVNRTYAGFTPEFYKQREQAYLGYAMPQIAQQYQQMGRGMTYGLANKGLLHSGAAATQKDQLEQMRQGATMDAAETARTQSQQLQQQVEQARLNALNQLYRAVSPGQGQQSAINVAAGYQQPSALGPVLGMLGNAANQYYFNTMMDAYNKPTSNSKS